MLSIQQPGDEPLTWWERIGLGFLALLLLAFGVLVVVRSAFQNDRKTDFGVYARAGFATRNVLVERLFPEAIAEEHRKLGRTEDVIQNRKDLYRIMDDRGWHYCYPPAFAIVMMPLADPFRSEERTGFLPFGLSVSIWYLLSLGLVAYSVHRFASVLTTARTGSRRWWYARTIPFYVCLGGIGYTLSRGQVNILLLALLAAMFYSAIKGRDFWSGFWLAAAIALKVIPALMLLFPLLRTRELMRTGVGVMAGTLFFWGLLPAAIWGVEGAVEIDKAVFKQVLAPGAAGTGDMTREKELTGAKATDSQSFQAVFHNIRYPDRETRPDVVDSSLRLAHWIICGAMIAITFLAGVGKRDPVDRLIYLGLLSTVMLLTTPVSHMHYYALVLPLASGLWLKSGGNTADFLRFLPLLLWGILSSLPLFPPFLDISLLDMGLATFSTVGLWLYGVYRLASSSRGGE